jgi:glycosyltransferase involved in cell wall biosynthesis
MSSVDVIVPCYRYGNFLRECVTSVLAQSVQNVRVLIIDDASPDNTAEVASDLAREDPRVTFLRHAQNKGHIATYNEGIDWVSADYLLLLSADDFLLPGALGRATDLMDAHPEVGFTFGKAVILDDRGATSQTNADDGFEDKKGWRILTGLEFIELSGSRNIVPTPTAVVRTELQKRLGGYRPELPHSGDMEMWLRLAAHASVGMSEAYEAVYRRHAGNMSLEYTMKTWLPDLQQRRAAFDCFFQTCSYVIPDAQQLRRKLFLLLGRDAVGYASSAFNEGKMEVSEEISQYALELSPEVKGSLQWTKLACKRFLGYGAWHALQPALAIIRKRSYR